MSDVIQEWTQTCAVVAECASTLGGDPPQPERLRDLREHVQVLEQCRRRGTYRFLRNFMIPWSPFSTRVAGSISWRSSPTL